MNNSNEYNRQSLDPADIAAITAQARTERSKAFWSILIEPLFGRRETPGTRREPSAPQSIGHGHQAA